MGTTDFSSNCGDSDTGMLKSDGTLCLGSNKIASAMTASQFYIMSTEEDTVFSEAIDDKNIIIAATANTLIYDNLETNVGVQLFASSTKVTADNTGITNSNNTKLRLYVCSDEGVCYSVEGYVTDGTNYYEVKSDGSASAKVTPSGDCASSTVGKLVSENKLCLGTESIEFFGNGKSGYNIINDGKYKFVRGIENVFTKEEFQGKRKKEFFFI